MHKKLQQLKPYLLLLIILFIAYLPLSTLYFGMKNDAFSDNFPNKYFLSEALHSGRLSLWNPYMNFGFPVYADPGFAFWNPTTWLLAFIGYSAYTLTVEVLLYIYLAGVFMFKLGRFLKFTQNTSVTIAAMYMCSGFFIGCLQYINFLTSAAFLPLLILTFLQCLQQPNYRNSFLLAIAGYFVFAGGHPAIPFATLYFLVIFTIILFLVYREFRANYKRNFFFLTLALILFVLLASPALYSYLNIFGSLSESSFHKNIQLINAGFNPDSYLSFVFPFATAVKQPVFSNDISMRNGYISVIGIASLFCCFIYRNKLSIAFLITGLLMLVLCVGGDFKIELYERLPLLNFIRTNGQFRVFTILCFCISAGFSLEQLFTNDSFKQYFLKILQTLLIIISVITITLIIISVSDIRSDLSFLNNIAGTTSKIKWFLDEGSFKLFFLISSFLSIGVLAASIYFIKKNKFTLLSFCIIADLIINSIIYLPVTGIGQVTLSQIQSIYDSNPNGIPIPPLAPISSIDTLDAKTTGLIGDITYYNKKIGAQKLTDYPIYFKTTDSFFNSSISKQVYKMSYAFLKSDFTESINHSNLAVTKFTPTHIQLSVNSRGQDTLVLLQNYYKYWNAFRNNTAVPIQKSFIAFMGVAVNTENNTIDFYYKDRWLLLFVCISVGTLLINIIFLLRKENRGNF